MCGGNDRSPLAMLLVPETGIGGAFGGGAINGGRGELIWLLGALLFLLESMHVVKAPPDVDEGGLLDKRSILVSCCGGDGISLAAAIEAADLLVVLYRRLDKLVSAEMDGSLVSTQLCSIREGVARALQVTARFRSLHRDFIGACEAYDERLQYSLMCANTKASNRAFHNIFAVLTPRCYADVVRVLVASGDSSRALLMAMSALPFTGIDSRACLEVRGAHLPVLRCPQIATTLGLSQRDATTGNLVVTFLDPTYKVLPNVMWATAVDLLSTLITAAHISKGPAVAMSALKACLGHVVRVRE